MKENSSHLKYGLTKKLAGKFEPNQVLSDVSKLTKTPNAFSFFGYLFLCKSLYRLSRKDGVSESDMFEPKPKVTTPASKASKAKAVKTKEDAEVEVPQSELKLTGKKLPTTGTKRAKTVKTKAGEEVEVSQAELKPDPKRASTVGSKRGKAASGPKTGPKKLKGKATTSPVIPEKPDNQFVIDYLATTSTTLFDVSLIQYSECLRNIPNHPFPVHFEYGRTIKYSWCS